MGLVVDKFLKELNAQLAERKVTLELTEAGRKYLAEKGYDKDNGARPLGRLVQDEVKRPLTEELLFGELELGGHVVVDEQDGKLKFDLRGNPKPGAPPLKLLN
jgi:ATP-dependent Clp protease ATP-binding subunit ClpA